jgi:N6-adenosine-specific RNA methylase IME4
VRYRTIVADPPWRVHRPKGGWRTGVHTSQSLSYPTMSIDEIAALPVGELADDVCHLYIWTINRYVEQTYGIARAWGFKPAQLLVWAKAPMGLGSGGIYSMTTEYILLARRGSEGRNPDHRHPTTWWNWKRGEHSAKPDAFLDIVEEVSPGPYVELFARRARFGWDYWGDESLGTAELVA